MYVADSKRLTRAGARKMMDSATHAAEKAGVAIAVAIADSGGHLIMLERMDGGRFTTGHSSPTQAACAQLNNRPPPAKGAAGPAPPTRPTTAKGAPGQDLATAHAIGLALAAGPERWTPMEGGYRIFVGGECIGGTGAPAVASAFHVRPPP